jgi:hypothetical protein
VSSQWVHDRMQKLQEGVVYSPNKEAIRMRLDLWGGTVFGVNFRVTNTFLSGTTSRAAHRQDADGAWAAVRSDEGGGRSKDSVRNMNGAKL